MAKRFVFGETKVAKTSEEIREHNDSDTANTQSKETSVEEKHVEIASAIETSSVQQEIPAHDDVDSTAVDTETMEQPMVTTKERKRKKPEANERFATKGVKTENGIVVNVPMDDYMKLMMLKIQTGRTLKDLALQAIHEFVERNK